jgi:hypothetical protein
MEEEWTAHDKGDCCRMELNNSRSRYTFTSFLYFFWGENLEMILFFQRKDINK